MDDLISRSALIAELEAFKMSMGDIVLRFVVDRVIDLVKNQPAATIQLHHVLIDENRVPEVKLQFGNDTLTLHTDPVDARKWDQVLKKWVTP